MKNQREIYEALLAGETLIEGLSSSVRKITMNNEGESRFNNQSLCIIHNLIPDHWQIYKEPKWYENIPNGGVLCRCNDGLIVDIAKKSADRLVNKKGGYFTFDFVVPLTKREIQTFMDNAPNE